MPIEDIIDLCGPNFDARIQDYDVPLFSNGYHAIRSPETMMEYLKKGLPDEYARRSADNVMNVVGSIGADWCGTSSPKRKSQQRSSSKTSDGTKIQIILVDDTNEDERHSFGFDIGSSTTLKTVFNEYAEKRSVSLRSLRFSYAGKTLFLSSVGNRTPEEMQMRDQDVISVHDTNKPSSQESSSNGNANNQTNKSSSPKKSKPTSSKSGSSSKKNKGKNKKAKGTKEKHPIYSSTLSIEGYKAQHSKVLSKLHEEVQSQLKDTDEIECIGFGTSATQAEKERRRTRTSPSSLVVLNVKSCLLTQVLVGKLVSHTFLCKLGRYRICTRLPNQLFSSRSSSSNTPVLDLRGCTREEALVKLDDSLNVWIDIAQRGNYPFVKCLQK